MRRICLLVLLVFGAGIFYLGAQENNNLSEKPKPDTTLNIAEVNGKPLAHQQLYKRLVRINGRDVLNQMIEEMVIEDEAKAAGVTVAENEIKKELEKAKKLFNTDKDYNNWLNSQGLTEDDLKAQTGFQILKRKLIIKEKGIQVAAEEIEKYFNDNKDKLSTPEQILVRHILVKSQQQAEDILIAVNAGADFAAMAKAKSEDSAAKDTGGSIGFFSRGMLLPEFENAAFNLKPGEVSGSVKTKLGFHIIKLEEQKKSIPAKLNGEMKEKIKETLLYQKISSALNDWLNDLKAKSKIVVY